MLTSLPFIACPTRCKERLSGLWLGVFFIHSKCTTPSLSKKPTCWNFSVKAMLGQLVSTGLPPWKRTNLNGVHQGCRPQHFLLRLPPPQACHSREQTESVTHWQSQSAVVNHPPRRSQSPSAPPTGGERWLHCGVLPYIYIYYMHVFFPSNMQHVCLFQALALQMIAHWPFLLTTQHTV